MQHHTPRVFPRRAPRPAWAVMLAVVCLSPAAFAQEAGEQEMARQAIMYPTGERETSTLMIEKIMPTDVRAGQKFQYQIQVTNLSEAPIVGIRVREFLPSGVAIAESEPQVQMLNQPQGAVQHAQQASAQQGPQQGQQQQGEQNQQQQGQQQNQQQTARQGGQQQGQQAQNQSGRGNPVQAAWYVQELMPGETSTVTVSAIPGQAGQLASCITVDFEPSLCTVMNVVNPQITLQKQGPQQVDLCEPLTYTYTVANTGTGEAENVVIRDPLPEGLVTEQGQQIVEIEVGALAPDDPKQFEVVLRPSRTGSFASRAVAQSAGGEAYSQEVSTEVVQPELAVQVQSPQWEYVDRQFRAQIVVTNNGSAPARNVALEVNTPEGEVAAVTPEGYEGAQLAAATEGPQAVGGTELGTIEPGESRQVPVTFVGNAEGNVQIQAVATAVCGDEGITARGAAQTYIATIPALVIEVVDQEGVVNVGNNAVYEIAIKNQGSGDARNVQLQAQLPEGMTFVSGEGQTNVQTEGGMLNFGTIESLAPGEVASWMVAARADQAGQKRFQLQVNAQHLNKPVTETEPTRVIQ